MLIYIATIVAFNALNSDPSFIQRFHEVSEDNTKNIRQQVHHDVKCTSTLSTRTFTNLCHHRIGMEMTSLLMSSDVNNENVNSEYIDCHQYVPSEERDEDDVLAGTTSRWQLPHHYCTVCVGCKQALGVRCERQADYRSGEVLPLDVSDYHQIP